MLRLPATHIRSLICFASGVHAILLASCFATCAPGRIGGDFRARAIVQPATQTAGALARGRERDLPGSQTIHPVPLPRSATPAEPTIPRLSDGLVDAAPALPTARASALNEFRGSITRLWHLLPTLQDWCCHHPCKARFRLAGSPLPGGSRTLRIATKGFRSHSHPPFLDLSWRKGSFIWSSGCPLILQAGAHDTMADCDVFHAHGVRSLADASPMNRVIPQPH